MNSFNIDHHRAKALLASLREIEKIGEQATGAADNDRRYHDESAIDRGLAEHVVKKFNFIGPDILDWFENCVLSRLYNDDPRFSEASEELRALVKLKEKELLE